MKRMFILLCVSLFIIKGIAQNTNWNHYSVSEPVVVGQDGIPFQGFWPDGKLCMLPNADGNFICYWGEASTYRTEANSPYIEDHIKKISQGGLVFGKNKNTVPGLSDGGAWMIGIHPLGEGNLVAFFHAESHWETSNNGEAYKSIGVTYSSDNGLTWGPGKRFLAVNYAKPESPTWSGLGDGCVVWNPQSKQYICYYSAMSGGSYRICMAASSDINGAPGSWKKWDGNSFKSEGCDINSQLGGEDSYINGLYSKSGSNPSVMWNTYLNRWIMVYYGWGNDILMSSSIDGIKWETPVKVFEETGDHRYPNLISEAGDLVGGKSIRLYYARNQQSNGIRQLAYRELVFFENIIFSDPNVKALCVAHWDTNGDGELSDTEAMAVTSLDGAFKKNTAITSFNKLQYFTGLTRINKKAFQGCTGLTEVSIPNSVASIGKRAFMNCSGLKTVTCEAVNVPKTGNKAFQNVPQSSATLYVPASSVDAYKAADQWKKFGTILPIGPTGRQEVYGAAGIR
jgi:hypothetical protein